MTPTDPLYKRLKRHVIGRKRSYFIASPPGFESLCLKELMSLPLTNKEVSVVPGGVEFQGRLSDCYLINLYLRSASRILMRIHQFKASNFRQFEKRVADIPWELYLPPNSLPDIRSTTKHCRLYHTDAIREHFLTGITKHLADVHFEEKNERDFSHKQKIFIRGVDDLFTASIDSSGAHLHKRGLKRHFGKAPLRETIAAAALLMAGYTGSQPLIDPMCGTGTFSLEAALMAKNIPPGWFRKFAFMGWPSFRKGQWKYLKRRSEEKIAALQTTSIFASDKDPFACDRLANCVAQYNLSEVISVSRRNFFDFTPDELTDQIGIVTINPPYGRRIGSGPKKSETLFLAICNRLKQEYKGWKLVLIVPNQLLKKEFPFQLDRLSFSHGGLKLTLLIGFIT